MIVLVSAVEAPPGAATGYAYGRTERGREVVIVAPIAHMARLARRVERAPDAVRVWAPLASVLAVSR